MWSSKDEQCMLHLCQKVILLISLFDADSFLSANDNTIINANYSGLSNMIIMEGTALMYASDI